MAASPRPSRAILLGISTVATVVALGSTYALTGGPAAETAPRAERSLGDLPPDDFGGPATPSPSVSPTSSSTQIAAPSPSATPKKRPSDPTSPNRSSDRPAESEAEEAEPLAAPAEVSGFPGSGSTGVPASTKLRVHRGDLTIRTAGKVIDGVEVHGKVSVEAPNVTIRNSRVIVPTGSETAGISNNNDNGRGMVVRNVEVRAASAAPGVNGVLGHDFTLERSEVHHVTDQVHITGSNVTVRDNWFHHNYHFSSDPYQGGGASHDDSIQIIGGGNITIAGNRFTGAYNAGVMITQSIGDVDGVTIRDNLLGGGGCTVNISEKGRGPVGGLVIRDNRFLSDQRVDGCAIIRPSSTNITHSGNVWHESGRKVALSRG